MNLHLFLVGMDEATEEQARWCWWLNPEPVEHKRLILSLANRIADQSEILSRKAEKRNAS